METQAKWKLHFHSFHVTRLFLYPLKVVTQRDHWHEMVLRRKVILTTKSGGVLRTSKTPVMELAFEIPND